MKKNFFYLLIACLAFTFAACSDDDDDSKAKSVVPVTPPSNVEEIVDIKLKQTEQQEAEKPLPFHEVSLLAENQVLVGPFDDEVIDNFPTAKTRSTTAGGYIAGGKYYLGYYMNDDEENAIIILSNKGQKETAFAYLLFTKRNADGSYNPTDLVGVRMLDPESESWVEMSCAADAKKIDKNEATAALCNTWKVAYSRLRHTGDVKAVHQFDKAVTGENPASLNDILAYALTKANIDQKFDENMVISQITFTPGRFIILFDNGKDYIGDWEWENRSKGELAYAWEDAEMGNAFESGMAVFDVRPYKQQDYYALTMGADIESTKAGEGKKSYTVELTFFLQQKK